MRMSKDQASQFAWDVRSQGLYGDGDAARLFSAPEGMLCTVQKGRSPFVPSSRPPRGLGASAPASTASGRFVVPTRRSHSARADRSHALRADRVYYSRPQPSAPDLVARNPAGPEDREAWPPLRRRDSSSLTRRPVLSLRREVP